MTGYSKDKVERIHTLMDLGVPKAKIARTWGISRQTLYTWLEKYKKTSPLTQV